MRREAIIQNLQRSVLFRDATERELASFAEVARVQIVAEGQFVYSLGDPSDVFYVIALGEAELVLNREDGFSKIVGRIGRGGHFGETGILTNKPRSLSVRALCDMVVICFDKRYFRTAFLSNGRIHKQLDTALAERLRVAFVDQLDSGTHERSEDMSEAEDVILFKEKSLTGIQLRRLARRRMEDIRQSKTARRTQSVINDFAGSCEPFLLTGESGTGKSMIARQVHVQSRRRGCQYIEVDLRDYEPMQLERKLFGREQSTFPFAQARQAGLFEQASGGTLVFTHIHLMRQDFQEKLVRIIESSTYSHVDSDRQHAMQARIVFISTYSPDHLTSTEKIIPELLDFFTGHHFEVPPLRDHKEDLPRLVNHYLERFSREYGKNISKVSPETLGIFMNYDWPGNLTELSSVIRRAVMLAKENEILADQILLGLPKTEGKWEYNILRIGWIRRLLSSALFPRVPQFVIGSVLLITILFLFLGPSDRAEENLGLTLGWYIGWPLMFFSFFFLARTWCAVCTLAVPGTLIQNILKPTRKTPKFIKDYSGWIMATLCILVFWVEIVWNAYDSPYLTGAIILIISLGSVLFSSIYSRRTWCRYLCPLGAVNAIFAMPSVIELRSNRHVCMNRCRNHSCFHGDAEIPGCPMFRHPYLVDNNRDCIMCAKCIKSCENSSIQLNLRLAPQELWALETPRKADGFLIVAMAAIFFPFAMQDEFRQLSYWLAEFLEQTTTIRMPQSLIASVLFFANIVIFQVGYYLMVTLQSVWGKMDRNLLLPLFGYGFIPMILGGFLAFHLEAFVSGAGRIIPNLCEILGLSYSYTDLRLISPDSTYVLQFLTVLGGLLASLYATYRVIERALVGEPVTSKKLALPFSFLVTLAGLYVFIV